jgi:hypothetical protein
MDKQASSAPVIGEAQATGEEAIDKILERVDHPSAAPPPLEAIGQVGLRTARVRAIEGRDVKLTWRGQAGDVAGAIADEVDVALIRRALERREAVLVETAPEAVPLVVGVVQTRLERNVELRGETITIDAEREVLLRAGRAAVRLREDGDLEIVGSRIAAMSRGLFRIVGRVLRLN